MPRMEFAGKAVLTFSGAMLATANTVTERVYRVRIKELA
jgi:hypothetical protein